MTQAFVLSVHAVPLRSSSPSSFLLSKGDNASMYQVTIVVSVHHLRKQTLFAYSMVTQEIFDLPPLQKCVVFGDKVAHVNTRFVFFFQNQGCHTCMFPTVII